MTACSYTGHLPTMKLDYGETYGKHGVKYFQDFRSRALETSKNNISRGGYFPSIHTFGPDPAVESRTRKWDRWLQTPHYRLHNEDHDRRETLIDFCKVRQGRTQGRGHVGLASPNGCMIVHN